MIKKFNQMNESVDRLRELHAQRKQLLEEIDDIDSEIESISTDSTIYGDPIAKLNAWLQRPSHKNKRNYLPSGETRKWLDDYVWKDHFGDPDFFPKHSMQSLVDLLQEYGMDHDNGKYKGPGDKRNTIDFQLGVNGITEKLIDYIIAEDYDEFEIDW